MASQAKGTSGEGTDPHQGALLYQQKICLIGETHCLALSVRLQRERCLASKENYLALLARCLQSKARWFPPRQARLEAM